MTLYETLEVTPTATLEDIRKAYKRLSKKYHPDHDPTTAGSEKFKAIQEAWAVLGDADKRAHYDKFGTAAKALDIDVAGNKSVYTLRSKIASGDVSDVFHATAGPNDYIVKVSRFATPQTLLDHEFKIVSKLFTASKGDIHSRFLPTPVETFTVRDRKIKRVNVFTFREGFYTLEQVRAKYPNGIAAHHIVARFTHL